MLCLLLLSYIAQCAHAQARQDRQSISFTRVSPSLRKFSGWFYDTYAGKWLEHEIYVGDDAHYPGRCPSLYWLQTAHFDYRGQSYYVWFYSYPGDGEKSWTKKSGWNVAYMVMNPPHYRQVLEAMEHTGRTKIPVSRNLVYEPMNDSIKAVTNAISAKLEENPELFKSGYEYDTAFIDIQLIGGKKIARFDLTGWVNAIEPTGYFETDYASLKAAFIPLTPADRAYTDSLANPVMSDAKATPTAHHIRPAAEAVISDWQTSDTLYSRSCDIVDRRKTGTLPFDWMAVSSYTCFEKKYYCIYDHRVENGLDSIDIMVTDKATYNQLRRFLNEKTGLDNAIIATKCRSLGGNDNLTTYLSNLAESQSGETWYFGLNIGKKVAMFNPPIGIRSLTYLFKDRNGPAYYQCDIRFIEGLLKLQ